MILKAEDALGERTVMVGSVEEVLETYFILSEDSELYSVYYWTED